MKTRAIAKILYSIFFITLVSVSLFARDVEIIIIDADLELPLERAVIRSWDASEHICDSEGKAIISAPDDRRVVIQVSYPGYETNRLLITLDAGTFTLGMHLCEMLTSKELVIEAAKPGENETKTGRSIALSGQEISQTGKIGAIEDTMASIKLLPGIIATEHFDASPSIRGGEPHDVNASLDGFYITSPYFWGGAFSIFDPRMTESAQLSHGVFSARHGHTVSGLLDLTTKKPSATETEIELGTDASAVRLNVSIPFNNKGGILIMGRTTYIKPIFFLAQQVVNIPAMNEDIKDIINSINRAPFLRSQTVTGNYKFTDMLEYSATALFGVDGTGVKFENTSQIDGLNSYDKFALDYTVYQGFFTNSLLWNPANDMLLKFTVGSGFQNKVSYQEEIYNIYDKTFSNNFKNEYGYLSDLGLVDFEQNYLLTETSVNSNSELVYNIQGRVDYDWDLGNNFLLSLGAQQMYRQYRASASLNTHAETWLKDFDDKETVINLLGISSDIENQLMISSPVIHDYDITGNSLFISSGYSLIEYLSPRGYLGTELGLRIDRYFLQGSEILVKTKPLLNPRINMDFNLLNNISLTIGTGLFSSMPDTVLAIDDLSVIEEFKPARSWTSVLGANIKFPYSIIMNIEGYYKNIFTRMYSPYHFDGEGRGWGADAMLQRTRSHYWDGWISYSYNWTQYRDPLLNNEWYFPYYHRFHSLNMVLNVKPAQRINLYTRFGFASGVQLKKRVGAEPVSYPEYIYDPETEQGYFIEKYYWPEIQDEKNRTTVSLQLDMKVSIFNTSKKGKARSEVYFAVENILSVLYFSKGNTVFNPYTGEVSTGRTSASYGLPFPIPSFGVNLSY